MTPKEVERAHALLSQLAGLKKRLADVSTAQTLTDVTAALIATGLEERILDRSRRDVSDFIQVAINDVTTQLAALGVTVS